MITPEEFVRMFPSEKEFNQPNKKETRNDKDEKYIKLAKVDPNYTSGRPSVIYDSDIASGTLSKPLTRLASYTPAANDRVLIVKGIIIGKIV
jgi:hypothetical protein